MFRIRKLGNTRTVVKEKDIEPSPGHQRAWKFEVTIYAENVEDAAEDLGYRKSSKSWDEHAPDYDRVTEVTE